MSAGFLVPGVDAHQLAAVITNRIEKVLIIDSRSFLEHNTCHISSAVNVCCSKIVKRRLQQDKLSVKELLADTCDVDDKLDIVVYDQSSKDSAILPVESFTVILIKKLQLTFRSVNLLTGGFDEFQKLYPDLCENKTLPSLTSLSQPCLPIANQGPTRILPFLYLGSQFDAMNKELLKDRNITYELNVSTSCPQPEFLPEGHFLRIPVNDTYSEKLLPYFPEAFNFLDKVREGSGCVLVHCLAGISRSPTVAIAYVMRYLYLSSDDGYKYVKSKRPTISPNFNFLGQLLEYEKQLRRENVLEGHSEVTSAPAICSQKRVCRTDMRTSKLSLDIQKNDNLFLPPPSGDQSPTTALAKLSFDVQQTPSNGKNSLDFRRSKSCYGLRDTNTEKKTATTSSKVLSPVKEIKCDALISEISTGNLKSVGSIRQRSSYHGGDGKQLDSNFSVEKYYSASEERFSLQTLTHHQTFKSNQAKIFETPKSKEQVKGRSSSPLKFLESSKTFHHEVKKITKSSDYGKKRIFQLCRDDTPIERSKDFICKDKTEPHLVLRDSTVYSKSSSLPPSPFNIDSYKRSNSSGSTSGFGSESSDCTEKASEVGKKPEYFRLDIDLEELEDDVIPINIQDEKKLRNRSFFLSAFPDVTRFPNLASPLSPSESHLLVDMEKDTCRTDPSSPSSYPSEDSFHDSGVPLSPIWVWPRKRLADFDPACRSYSPDRDKQTCESVHQSRTLAFSRSASPIKRKNCAAGTNSYQFCDSAGLYRVQSCPGILSQVSSLYARQYSTPKCFNKGPDAQDIISHESCPDVLHLGDIESSTEMQLYRQKEFRRNVRCIQVS